MDRLACIDLPSFPLQLHFQEHPGRRRSPTAVIDRDSPQGLLLWVNEAARRSRILPGMRYAAALSILPGLQAGIVSKNRIANGVGAITRILYGFSPEVEVDDDFPGTFWLDASGLVPLHPSLHRWARSLRDRLRREGFAATIAVGFSRFGTYAATRRPGSLRIFEDVARERATLHTVKLDRLDLDPQVRDALARLGVSTLGDFLRLPPGGLRDRFGEDVHRFYRLAAGEEWDPFRPDLPETPLMERTILDHPLADTPRLVFLLRPLVGRLLQRLADRSESVGEMTLSLILERRSGARASIEREERLQPAEPTLEERILVDLLRLRLESLELPRGIVEIRIRVSATPATTEQLELFRGHPRRDLRCAGRALARLRSEFGHDAVVIARLRPRHLPEASFEWQPIVRLDRARPRNVYGPRLLRRIREKPTPLPRQTTSVRNDGWLLRDLEQGGVVYALGPYIVSGGWWAHPVHREYHYIQTESGDWLWVYFDRRRRRWFLHGTVE